MLIVGGGLLWLFSILYHFFGLLVLLLLQLCLSRYFHLQNCSLMLVKCVWIFFVLARVTFLIFMTLLLLLGLLKLFGEHIWGNSLSHNHISMILLAVQRQWCYIFCIVWFRLTLMTEVCTAKIWWLSHNSMKLLLLFYSPLSRVTFSVKNICFLDIVVD